MLSCKWITNKLQERKAQILLPSALLMPIFVLVIYLLFETAKVSSIKIRQQFALDNAAYSQVSSMSTYLNAVAMVNGPLPYRVFLMYGDTDSFAPLQGRTSNDQPITVFDLFYQGGAFPSLGPEHETGYNLNPPAAQSTDWDFQYYKGENIDEGFSRADWEKDQPQLPSGDDSVPVMSKKLADTHFFMTREGGQAIEAYVFFLETYARTGSIYKSQDYVFKELTKNEIMFREAYFLNVNDCKRADCARQSAAQLRPYLAIQTKPFELNKIRFYASEASRSFGNVGAYNIDFVAEEILNGQKLFQFAYLDQSSRSKLKALSRGVMLKQPFKLPRNHFQINLEQKYKPYVRTQVVLACPRSSNNCVWPNPLPKYNVTLEP